MMSEIAELVRWLVVYAVSGGFLHFVAVFLIVRAITGITTLARVSVTTRAQKKEKKTDE
jgi:hypothetical protein